MTMPDVEKSAAYWAVAHRPTLADRLREAADRADKADALAAEYEGKAMPADVQVTLGAHLLAVLAVSERVAEEMDRVRRAGTKQDRASDERIAARVAADVASETKAEERAWRETAAALDARDRQRRYVQGDALRAAEVRRAGVAREMRARHELALGHLRTPSACGDAGGGRAPDR